MDMQNTNKEEKDLPEHPIGWLSQVSLMHPIEMLIAMGKFKEASRRAHLATLALAIVVLVLLSYFATRV